MSAVIRISDHTKKQLDEARLPDETNYDDVLMRLLLVWETVLAMPPSRIAREVARTA